MDFFRRHVFNHLGLKITSLVIAFALWMAIAREPMAEVAINVPIEFHNAPDNLELNSETIPQIQVRARGPVGVIRSLSTGDVHAVIDLNGSNPHEKTFDMEPKRIRVPRNVEIIQVIPSQVRISFDLRATKRVEVRPRVVGASAPGFRMQNVKVEPSTVVIAGPQKRVDVVDSVITDPVDASGVMGTATFTTRVYVSDPLIRLVNPLPVHVTVVTDSKPKANPSEGQ
ncbi:MAG TPA: CdaR family protein [Terriglobales bacterium]|nr:CdaR family protein [Terriglobales bacterium]